MQRRAKVFMNNRSQAVRLPKEFQFSTGEDDLFVAAHARSLGVRLVTNNTAEFGRVKGLTLENWTLPVRRARSRDDE